eukprot:12076867-Alexandrium_andersonii.AAC.1
MAERVILRGLVPAYSSRRYGLGTQMHGNVGIGMARLKKALLLGLGEHPASSFHGVEHFSQSPAACSHSQLVLAPPSFPE